MQDAFCAFYAAAEPALERLLLEHPELVGKPYASGIRPLWLLQPMFPLIDGDPSTWCAGCEPAILLGNYPKPNASVTHSDGLRGMLDKDARGGGFANDSIHALAGTLAASKAGSPATEIGRDKAQWLLQNRFVCMDVLPVQLYYRADVPRILAQLPPACLSLLQAFHPQVHASLRAVAEHKLGRRHRALQHALCLGTVPRDILDRPASRATALPRPQRLLLASA